MRDTPTLSPIDALVSGLRHSREPLDQARIAAQLRELAEETLGESIKSAHLAGRTWREIGAHLGVPFQTLYRRYGGLDAQRR